jgi:delta 1-pyrroline-5-carboxylate dehydrogenase
MDCYDHAARLLEYSFRLLLIQRFRRRTPRDAVQWSAVTRTAKELTVPYRSVNPATGEVLKTFTEHTDQKMMEALATADKAFVSWAGLPIDGRAKIISHAAQLLLEGKSELAKLATLEMGKRIAESRGEVELSVAILQYFADHAAEFLAPKAIKSAMGDAHLEFSPLGVLLSLKPCNYPINSWRDSYRTTSHVGQRYVAEARTRRAQMRRRVRTGLEGCRRSSGRLYQPLSQ